MSSAISRANRIAGSVVLIAAILLLCSEAVAVEPPSGSALGVYSKMPHDSSGQNEPYSWVPALRGYYFVITAKKILGIQDGPGFPDTAKDKIGGTADCYPAPITEIKNPYLYGRVIKIRPKTMGWYMIVIFYKDGSSETVYYRLYELGIIEDDHQNLAGIIKRPGAFDVRYGHKTDKNFDGLGGPSHNHHIQESDAAEDVLGYDDRTQGMTDEWTAVELPGGQRTPLWMPEMELKRDYVSTDNSLAATVRGRQTIQVLISGPEEGDGVPIRLVFSARNASTTGVLAPGGNPNCYYMDGHFQEPALPEEESDYTGEGTLLWPVTRHYIARHSRSQTSPSVTVSLPRAPLAVGRTIQRGGSLV